MKPLIIGSRGSPLALAQSHFIRDQLQAAHPGLTVEVKIIKTSGDLFQTMSLATAGGKGLFTKEIEEQLLTGEVDLAVHSLKDLPTTLPEGLTIGAMPAREDPRDVLVSHQYCRVDELPLGARVGTSSIRRKAQLLARRPDLRMEEIRGNIATRLRKLTSEGLAATILAAAGLRRLGLEAPAHPLDFDVMLPAVGQGLIGVEIRADDTRTRELLAPLNVPEAMACGEAERAFLRTMGGGCQVPFAAHATIAGGQLRLVGAQFNHDGTNPRRAEKTGRVTAAVQIGEQVAKEIQR